MRVDCFQNLFCPFKKGLAVLGFFEGKVQGQNNVCLLVSGCFLYFFTESQAWGTLDLFGCGAKNFYCLNFASANRLDIL